MEHIIQIDHLSKSFGSVKAVQDLNFRVKEGELFAFLGVNGAGKSTTINIMCGQLSKDGGSVVMDAHDLDKDMDFIKRELGVVFQSSVLDSALSVYDNLESRAALYGITGTAKEVDDYCSDKNVIGCDELGSLKIAYVLGEKTPLPRDINLQISTMNLQKLFVKLTEKGGN